jgi:serine/threonine protein kinase
MSDSGAEGTVLGIPGIDSAVQIGQSASHTTYRVRDTATGQMVVIKLLHAGRDWPGLQERFEREQTAMAALRHPNIVQVLGHGWTETGMPFIATTEVSGGSSIGDRLRGPTPMTGPDILALGVRLAGALESAHRADVVHGDLRPDDMMVTPQGEPLVADFGVVTLVRPNAADVTDPAELAHVAPELLDGQPASAQSDLYSLASALYTLFAGLPAYVRPGDQSIIPVIKRIASDPLPDLSSKNVPAPVVDAVSKGMAKAPKDRYQGAQELGRGLQQAQVALGLPMTEMAVLGTPRARGASPTRATTPVTTAPVADAPAVTAPTAVAPPAPPSRGTTAVAPAPPGPNRKPLVLAGIAAAAIVIIALGIFIATRGDDSDEAAPTTTTTTTTKDSTTTTSTTEPQSDTTEALTSDGGQLTLAVPETWSDHSTVSTPDGVPELQASTDLTEFAGTTFREHGVDFAVFPTDSVDPSDLNTALDQIMGISRNGTTIDALCTRGTRTSFTPNSSRLSAGLFEELTNCNGGGNVIIIAATDASLSFTALLEVHVGAPPDDAGVDVVTSSFDVVQFP